MRRYTGTDSWHPCGRWTFWVAMPPLTQAGLPDDQRARGAARRGREAVRTKALSSGPAGMERVIAPYPSWPTRGCLWIDTSPEDLADDVRNADPRALPAPCIERAGLNRGSGSSNFGNYPAEQSFTRRRKLPNRAPATKCPYCGADERTEVLIPVGH
jgi:hypothetical protein